MNEVDLQGARERHRVDGEKVQLNYAKVTQVVLVHGRILDLKDGAQRFEHLVERDQDACHWPRERLAELRPQISHFLERPLHLSCHTGQAIAYGPDATKAEAGDIIAAIALRGTPHDRNRCGTGFQTAGIRRRGDVRCHLSGLYDRHRVSGVHDAASRVGRRIAQRAELLEKLLRVVEDFAEGVRFEVAEDAGKRRPVKARTCAE
mmetsp:Transcript_47921/g.125468  ORF Transcript_47921/g.125468 Transcript_47921/m.125468 type:complete len:205 (-) Transcript_47921:307-921(-)